MYVHHTLIFAWAMNVLGGTVSTSDYTHCTCIKHNETLPRMLYVEVHILAAYNNDEHLSYRIAGNFRMVQNFMVFVDGSAAAKIKTMKNVLACVS